MWVVAVLAATLVVGAAVQGMVGLGVGLVSAPVVTWLAPDLMPGMMLFIGAMTPLATLLHERDDIDWRGIRWALPFRLPGTVLGVLVVAMVTGQVLGIAVGVMVLLGVLATVQTVRVPITRVTLALAGLCSGLTATTTSIGGPPIAVLYQHRPARTVRPTLAVYFAAGAVFSLVGLAVSGNLSGEDAAVSLMLVPAILLGTLLARLLRGRFPTESVRGGVLAVCAASGAVLLVSSLL